MAVNSWDWLTLEKWLQLCGAKADLAEVRAARDAVLAFVTAPLRVRVVQGNDSFGVLGWHVLVDGEEWVAVLYPDMAEEVAKRARAEVYADKVLRRVTL